MGDTFRKYTSSLNCLLFAENKCGEKENNILQHIFPTAHRTVFHATKSKKYLTIKKYDHKVCGTNKIIFFCSVVFGQNKKSCKKIGHRNVGESGLKKKFENDARLPVLLCRGYIIIWKAVDRPPPSAW